MKSIEERLKLILGETYGGPSLSFEGGQFVVYKWTDAPINLELVGAGKTLTAVCDSAEKLKRQRR